MYTLEHTLYVSDFVLIRKGSVVRFICQGKRSFWDRVATSVSVWITVCSVFCELPFAFPHKCEARSNLAKSVFHLSCNRLKQVN